MHGCLDADTAMDLLENRISEDTRAQMEAHVDECSGCRHFLAVLVRESAGAEEPSADGADAGFRLGEQVGRYELIRVAGVGGHGVVYEAYDPELSRNVALKVMHRRGQSEQQRVRLRREAQAMAQVHHANVAQVFDVGLHGGELFVAMEFLGGVTLSQWLREGKHSWRSIAEVVCLAGQGLAAAHRADLVHRDFKPDNIVFTDSGKRVCVTDFGLVSVGAAAEIAHDSDDGVDVTRTGASVGTPAYMAPEVFHGSAADARSDQFSFCITLFEALFGVRPFAGTTIGALREAVSRGAISEVLVPKGGAPVLRIVRRGLQADPNARYPSMDALLRELGAALASKNAKRRYPLAAGSGLVVAFAVGIFGLAGEGAEPSDVCGGAEAALASAWGEQPRAGLQNALAGNALGERLIAGLDAYGGVWTSHHKAACVATHIHKHQSEEDLRLRLSCLATRRIELGAFVHEVRANPALADKALMSLGALSAVADCSELDALRRMGSDVRNDEAYEGLQTEVARLQAKLQLGEAAQGLTFARELEPKLVAFNHPGLLAKGRAQLASLLQAAGDLEAAKNMYDAAISNAIAAKDEFLVATLWIGLAHLVGADQHKMAEARQLVRVAEVAIERVPRPALLSLRLLAVEATLASGAGELARAEEGFRSAAEGFERDAGAFHPRTLNALHNLGDVLRRLGKLGEAREIWQSLLRVQEERFGPRHSSVAATRMQLGHDAYQRGEMREALGHYQAVLSIRQEVLGAEAPKVGDAHTTVGLALRASGDASGARLHHKQALAIYTERLGAKHPNVALALNNLASTAYGEGKLREAKDLYFQAYEIKKAALGERHQGVAAPLFNYASVLRELDGRCEKAVSLWQEVLAIREDGLPADHPHIAYPLTSLGDCAVEAGESKRAIPMLERALNIRQTHQTAPTVTAETEFALAQALRSSAPKRSRELANKARQALIGAPEQVEFLGRIDAWLAR